MPLYPVFLHLRERSVLLVGGGNVAAAKLAGLIEAGARVTVVAPDIRPELISVGVAGRAGSNVEARDLWAQNNSLRGVFLGGALLSEYPRVHGMIAELLERVASGGLRVEIDRTFQLADAAAAHAYIESRQAFGRVVLAP